jgi:hypothetical protein
MLRIRLQVLPLAITAIMPFMQERELTQMTKLKQQYFKSWASYQIPMRPIDPIGYIDTESLTSFYLAEYDDRDELVRFTKYLRKAAATKEMPPNDRRPAGNFGYFSALPDDEGHFKPRAEIYYGDTEGSSEYFRTYVAKADNVLKMELIRTTVFFMDEYAYWPNKHLKSRIMHKKDGTVIKVSYDETGNEVRRE